MTIHVIVFGLAIVPAARLIERFGVRKLFTAAALVIGLSVAACSRAGYVFDLTNSYIAVFLLSALSLIGAFICVLKLRHETEFAR